MEASADETRVMVVYIEWCRYSAALSAVQMKRRAAARVVDSVRRR